MDLKNIINKKGEYADYMLKEITHICKDMDKRDPGSKGEKQACEYMANVAVKEPMLKALKKIRVRFSAGFISQSLLF